MVSVTLSIPKETKELMKKFSEINWSGLVRKAIEEKAKELSWKEETLKQFKQEENSGFIDFTVELGRKAKKESFNTMLSKLSAEERKELGL